MPTATSPAGGKLKVPHFDYKAKAVDWIKETIPDLYNKTLQIWPGWYPTNLAALPHGQNSWKFEPSFLLPIVGDIDHNFGVVVEGLLNAKQKAFGKDRKVAVCMSDYLPMANVVGVFEEVTGHRAAYAEISDETATKLYGVYYGAEYALQLRWSEAFPNWKQIEPENVLSLREMGVKDKLRKWLQGGTGDHQGSALFNR